MSWVIPPENRASKGRCGPRLRRDPHQNRLFRAFGHDFVQNQACRPTSPYSHDVHHQREMVLQLLYLIRSLQQGNRETAAAAT